MTAKTKADLQKENKKLKTLTDSRILLFWSMFVMTLGLVVLVMTPFMAKWFAIELDPLKFLKFSFPSGWGICVLSLSIQLIDKSPAIIESVRKTKG